jgi:hypothetical protein
VYLNALVFDGEMLNIAATETYEIKKAEPFLILPHFHFNE